MRFHFRRSLLSEESYRRQTTRRRSISDPRQYKFPTSASEPSQLQASRSCCRNCHSPSLIPALRPQTWRAPTSARRRIASSLPSILAAFPVPILAGLLASAGLLHIVLIKDLRHPAHRALAVDIGITGVFTNLAVALVGALAIWWAAEVVIARRSSRWDLLNGYTSTIPRAQGGGTRTKLFRFGKHR